MDKVKGYLDYIVEFGQDHIAAVVAGAVVLVILLLCFVLVWSARRQDREDEKSEDCATEKGCPEEAEIFEADEIKEESKEESKKDIDMKTETEPEAETEPETETATEIETETATPSQEQAEPLSGPLPEPLSDPLPEPIPETSSTKDETGTAPAREPAASELETVIVKTIEDRNLTALPAQFSTQNLKSVEVHIEKAHLTFHYASPEEESSLRKAETRVETMAESRPQELGVTDRHAAGDAAEFGTTGRGGSKDAAECGTADSAVADCDGGMDFTETEERQIETGLQTVKKYGAENRNVSRSGREYTVEELYVKIRD